MNDQASRLASSVTSRVPGVLWPRWLFLRALGLTFFSAFYALAFQIHGLVGTRGILPADEYLVQVAHALPGLDRFWAVPTVLWAGAGDGALTAVVATGIVCSLLLVFNVWPRLMVAGCTLAFLSCVSVLQDFSAYQSDGMLLEAGFVSLFFAPRGLRPKLGADDPPLRAALFLLQWEWFRIYFESGVVKLASGDPHWRDLTAMDHYYENGPLPAWPGWYVQHFPHWYHAATVLLTFAVELVVVWALFLPRRFRIACFVVVTALQLGIIATANYAFLNYLVLFLGLLLLDDRLLGPAVARLTRMVRGPGKGQGLWTGFTGLTGLRLVGDRPALGSPNPVNPVNPVQHALPEPSAAHPPTWHTWAAVAVLAWTFVATLEPVLPNGLLLLTVPARALAPFRVANTYGLFAVMTEARYEVEFQGTRDGQTWVAYPFRYKPQDPRERPGIYAPYQPRFDWNLWFASLGTWRDATWVVRAQQRLLENSPSVLALFRGNPFAGAPPVAVRTVRWRYWFTDPATKRATGRWWNREPMGPFAGVLTRDADGRLVLGGAP